ncbi:MAG: ATP-binding cassette domain-containing protein [Eubacterium sp.]|nr:ATP-binding cassette domain-containing protein [Eubacterium sp.]
MVLELKKITKKYNGETVLDDVSLTFETGKRYLIRGVSGAGKTTLIRIILGLEEPDAGHISIRTDSSSTETDTREYGSDEKKLLRDYRKNLKNIRFGTVFQEDRLCEEQNAVTNIHITSPGISKEEIISELGKLLPDEDVDKPVSELSGGMKRRVSLVRACVAKRDIYLLDEPFTGLDSENAERAARYIDEKTRDGILILTTHTEGFTGCIEGLDIIKL